MASRPQNSRCTSLDQGVVGEGGHDGVLVERVNGGDVPGQDGGQGWWCRSCRLLGEAWFALLTHPGCSRRWRVKSTSGHWLSGNGRVDNDLMAAGLTVGASPAPLTSASRRSTTTRWGVLEPAVGEPGHGLPVLRRRADPAAQVIRRLRDLEMPVADVKAVLAAPDAPAQPTP